MTSENLFLFIYFNVFFFGYKNGALIVSLVASVNKLPYFFITFFLWYLSVSALGTLLSGIQKKKKTKKARNSIIRGDWIAFFSWKIESKY